MNRMLLTSITALGLMLAGLVQAVPYNVQTIQQNTLVQAMPELPDLSRYTRQAVLDKQAVWHKKTARINLERMTNNVATRKFFKGGNLGVWAKKQGQYPKAVFVRDGLLALPELHRHLPDVLVKLNENQYLLRYPLVIMNHAALVISPGEELFMSHERGSFVVNAGDFFMVDGALRSWSEKEKAPARYSGNSEEYRPFYIGWSGSGTYIYGSLLESLGSHNSKAYGFTLSSYTEQDEMYAPNELNIKQRPTGWLINSRITDVYYGFYSYEAENVALVGNKYYDNIYYGIDPHDHSYRLIIANNEVWGTRVRHGIICSRDVSYSYIFGNVTHDNKLAGIMLDRASNHNFIIQNSSYNNGSDGISIYESHQNLIAANRIYNNKFHGIRFRNSLAIRMQDNVILQNGRYGVYGHLSDLMVNYNADSEHERRDLKLDPYEMRGSGAVSGGVIAMNGSGALFTQGLEEIGIGKLTLDQNGRRGNITLGGDLLPYSDVIARIWYGDSAPVYFRQPHLSRMNGQG